MIKKSIILGASMVMLSGGILVSAAQGTTVSGASKTTSYHGWVEGSRNSSNCYGATTTVIDSGNEKEYAYVEIVNADGYRIGNGASNTGNTRAHSSTITRTGGRNAYGSVGTSTGSSRTFARLY